MNTAECDKVAGRRNGSSGGSTYTVKTQEA
jgi:hypothetical protein